MVTSEPGPKPVPRRLRRRLARSIVLLMAAYLAIAYYALPFFWSERDARRILPASSMLTETAQGIPGDPINVGLIGAREEVLTAMAAAGWRPADPVTFRSSVEIGLSVILDRPYADAPVSALFFEGRKQDLAFEKPDGRSPDQRHHVRFWQAAGAMEDGTLWLGAASFDRGVGLSHDTGQITHHIGPDVDAERNLLVNDLKAACMAAQEETVEGRGATTDARNGGGDRYFTDGLAIVVKLAPPSSMGEECEPVAE